MKMSTSEKILFWIAGIVSIACLLIITGVL